MKLTELSPMLWTANLKESIEFYLNVIGFDNYEMSEEWGWGSVEKDSIKIMFAVPHANQPFEKPGFTGSLYIKCDNVDQMWDRAKQHARICYPIENFEYGMREFAIYDNNGYLIQFGQELG
jgi:uncharacterized glyoxalase superfamily protein PhnB